MKKTTKTATKKATPKTATTVKTEVERTDDEIGQVAVKRTSAVKVRCNEFNGVNYVDIRKFVALEDYHGPTKQGVSIPVADIPKLIGLLKKAIIG